MRALITGGAGFIGSHLAENLLKRDWEVNIIDDLSTGTFENIAHLENEKKFSYTIDTIMDIKVMEELVDRADVIYHLAAAVGVQYIIDNPLKALQVNIRGTEIILELANKKKKKALIASTSEIYGKSDKIPFSEKDDRVLGSTHISRWGYSASKAVDEFLALAYYREKRLPVVVVRLFNTVGPRQSGQYGMVIPKFVHQALLNHPLLVYGDGKQSRCFAYVEDVVNGMITLMEHPQAVGEIFNLGSKEPITIEELAKKVKELCQSRSEIIYVPYNQAYEEGFEDMKRRMPDLNKVKKLIGYEPQFNLDDILERVIEYFKT
ncbi:MAG: nucleoside-diphosphate sugar epimerase [Candidatus Cloacimonetes bacterium 4572_55]|nr:MAG: nucleoside-diphosphate sugar epimerase [Candidatus Cloacimonetes bacterium 4572_55]